jgi:hypothetical protein
MLPKWISNPKTIFLIDALGACLTAFLLAVVLARFETHFGMPRKVLYSLSLMACLLAIYSFICYFFSGKNLKIYLKIIALTNLVYCCITIGLVLFFWQQMTILGWGYFGGEVLVIGGLVWVEWGIDKIISKN